MPPIYLELISSKELFVFCASNRIALASARRQIVRMNLDALYSELTLKTKAKIVLIVLDGLGDIATREQNFLTPLEAATTPHLDKIAKESAQGRMIPVAPGITPGSG